MKRVNRDAVTRRRPAEPRTSRRDLRTNNLTLSLSRVRNVNLIPPNGRPMGPITVVRKNPCEPHDHTDGRPGRELREPSLSPVLLHGRASRQFTSPPLPPTVPHHTAFAIFLPHRRIAFSESNLSRRSHGEELPVRQRRVPGGRREGQAEAQRPHRREELRPAHAPPRVSRSFLPARLRVVL
jgi:hypothetical protein